MDSTTDLNCKNGIAHYGADDMEPTDNRSVAGSRPASPTQRPGQRPGVVASLVRRHSLVILLVLEGMTKQDGGAVIRKHRELLAGTLGRPRVELFSDEAARLELAA